MVKVRECFLTGLLLALLIALLLLFGVGVGWAGDKAMGTGASASVTSSGYSYK